jgi:hypothetical protein
MKRFLRQLFTDIVRGENIDLIITVILVMVISVLNSIGFASAQLISSITLTTLGLIAIGLLVTRYKIDDIHRRNDPANMIAFSTKKHPFLEADLTNATEIWMLGLVLRATTADNFHSFKRRVGQGLRLRALIVDPDEVSMEKVNKQFPRGFTDVQMRTLFDVVIGQYQELRQVANSVDNVQLRLIDITPPFSLYIFPHGANGGVVYVETYGYNSSSGSIPKYRISANENPIWYQHFTSQFELMWKDGKKANGH